jgi:hypothetical protein
VNIGNKLDEDLYEEISIPDIDYNERNELLKQLERRDKAQEELDLDECFKSLR